MAYSPLPPPPDFARLELAAERTAQQRQEFLALIGELNFGWSNNESLFIYVLMLLLETDEQSAAIVFSTLNTTRSRLDLVLRLTKAKITDPDLRREIESVVSIFGKSTAIRNDFNHATFIVGTDGKITHTQSTKLEEKRGRLSFGTRKPIDHQRLQDMTSNIQLLAVLNRRIWELLPRLEKASRPD